MSSSIRFFTKQQKTPLTPTPLPHYMYVVQNLPFSPPRPALQVTPWPHRVGKKNVHIHVFTLQHTVFTAHASVFSTSFHTISNFTPDLLHTPVYCLVIHEPGILRVRWPRPSPPWHACRWLKRTCWTWTLPSTKLYMLEWIEQSTHTHTHTHTLKYTHT